jgi:hypothetical protein
VGRGARRKEVPGSFSTFMRTGIWPIETPWLMADFPGAPRTTPRRRQSLPRVRKVLVTPSRA